MGYYFECKSFLKRGPNLETQAAHTPSPKKKTKQQQQQQLQQNNYNKHDRTCVRLEQLPCFA